MSGSGCLSTEELLDYVRGAPDAPPVERVHAHVESCSGCRIALAEATRKTSGSTSASDPTARTLALGEALLGRYEIRRFIAKGGMGEVYEAFDRALSETVALKTLTLVAADQVRAAERLLEEVRLARKVTHRNVCRILEFGTHCPPGRGRDLVPFLTMDLLAGETLAQSLASRKPIEPALARRILHDVVGGLGAVHAQGIVHRDLKPENVFLVPESDGPRAVVMDFGLAKAERPRAGWMTSANRVLVGTLDYMSPEQLQGRAATFASDIYAVGVIAFEMLTGRLPFEGDAPLARAGMKLLKAAPKPSMLVRGLDRGWDDLLGRCLDRDPSSRPSSNGEFARALDRSGGRTVRRPSAVRLVGLLGVFAVAVSFLLQMPSLPAERSDDTRPPPPVIVVTPSASLPHPAAPADSVQRRVQLVEHDGRALARRSTRAKSVQVSRVPSVNAPDSVSAERANAAVDSTSATSDLDPFAPAKTRPRHPDDLVNPYLR